MVDVSGRWALITGASRGIGHEIALFMAKKGCNLILHSRNTDHTKRIEAEVKEYGVKVYSVQAELSKMSEVEAMLEQIDTLGVTVDLIFNNAAVSFYRRDYMNTPISDFEQCFAVNTLAPIAICCHYLPKMIQNGFGRIVNITSRLKNEPKQMAYTASKGGLEKFTRDYGSVLEGTDVCMNLTDPGWVRTDMGSESAPSDVSTCFPGIVVEAFIGDQRSGRLLPAQNYRGMTLEQAVNLAECTSGCVY